MSTYRSTSLRPLSAIFAGHHAGHYELPKAVTDAMAAIDRAKAEATAVAAEPDGMTGHDLITAIADAARTGAKFPTGATLAKAEAERATRDAYWGALNRATEALEDELETTIRANAETIITDSLRPALAEVMDETTELAELLSPYGTDHAALLEAPENARKARKRLDVLAARYRSIRDAQGTLTRLLGDPGDSGRYATLRNMDDLTAGQTRGTVPWPTDSTVDALMWFAAHDAEVWMPTLTERAALVAEQVEQSSMRPSAMLIGR